MEWKTHDESIRKRKYTLNILAGCIYLLFSSFFRENKWMCGKKNECHRKFKTKPKNTHLHSSRFERKRDLSAASTLKCLLTGFWSYVKHVFIYGHIIIIKSAQLTIIY